MIHHRTKAWQAKLRNRTKKVTLHTPMSEGKKLYILKGEQLGRIAKMPVFMCRALNEVTDICGGYGDKETLIFFHLN